MKILIMSDTHGCTLKAEQLLKKCRDIDLVIHLGDYFRDAQKLTDEFPGVRIEYICGNSDFLPGDIPSEKLLEYGGKRIFLTHGHRYSVKWNYDKLESKAEQVQADILLFGHTHIAEVVEKNGYVLLNPGSISYPRDNSDGSYALVELNGSGIHYRLCYT